MLTLPLTGSPARELFDVSDLVEFRKLPTFRDAQTSARRFMESDAAVRSVNALCIRACGDVHLTHFGPKGGHKVVWNFGNPVKAAS